MPEFKVMGKYYNDLKSCQAKKINIKNTDYLLGSYYLKFLSNILLCIEIFMEKQVLYLVNKSFSCVVYINLPSNY